MSQNANTIQFRHQYDSFTQSGYRQTDVNYGQQAITAGNFDPFQPCVPGGTDFIPVNAGASTDQYPNHPGSYNNNNNNYTQFRGTQFTCWSNQPNYYYNQGQMVPPSYAPRPEDTFYDANGLVHLVSGQRNGRLSVANQLPVSNVAEQELANQRFVMI